MKMLKYVLVSFLLLCFMSCSKKKNKIDSTKPVVTISSPTSSSLVHPGDILNIKALLSDNIKLQKYVAKIGSGSTKQGKNIVDYSFNSLTDLDAYGKALPTIDGKEKVDLDFDIQIEEKARYGNYIFTLSVFDQSENETKLSVEFELSLKD